MSTYQQATQFELRGDRYELRFPKLSAIWGVNGGFLAAATLHLAKVRTSHPVPVSLSCSFLASVLDGEPVFATVDPLKTGKSADLIEVKLWQRDRLCVVSHIWTSTTRVGPQHTLAVPAAESYEDRHTWEEAGGELIPFWDNFDAKGIPLDPPQSPTNVRDMNWIRYRDTPNEDPYEAAGRTLPLIDTLGLSAFRDSYGESFLNTLMPTIQLSALFYGERNLQPWMLCEALGDTAKNGMISARVRIWGGGQRLVSQGLTQMVVQPGSGVLVVPGPAVAVAETATVSG